MAAENSFDIVSKSDIQEVRNAVDQASKEVGARFDLKASNSKIELEGDDKIKLASASEYTLEAVKQILSQKLVKRGISLKALTFGKLEEATHNSVRQEITLAQGIPSEKAKDIVKALKDSKLKVNASIQGDTVRVSGKDRDTLQQAIALVKGKDFGIDTQFTNFRTN